MKLIIIVLMFQTFASLSYAFENTCKTTNIEGYASIIVNNYYLQYNSAQDRDQILSRLEKIGACSVSNCTIQVSPGGYPAVSIQNGNTVPFDTLIEAIAFIERLQNISAICN